jgi:hypothetical protein
VWHPPNEPNLMGASRCGHVRPTVDLGKGHLSGVAAHDKGRILLVSLEKTSAR